MQQIYQGIQHLAGKLADESKVLLVCDSSFKHLNIKDDIERIVVPKVVFNDFTPNPTYEAVCNGIDLFRSNKCNAVLAVGGGSSIDVAKCIKLYCQMPKDDLYFEQEYQDTGVPLIAIPTTAGTGSESTRYAVIYYNGKKQSITHNSIIPNIAILEPNVLKTLPIYQKKCTMIDALCQGIESWWSVNSTGKSKEYSRIAVNTIAQWWREYIFGDSDDAAIQIMKAANYAGRAINITQTTAPHAFSYKLTSLYNLPHGHAVGICLPEIWDYMTNHMDRCIDSRGSEYLNEIFGNISVTMGMTTIQSCVAFIKAMMHELGLKRPIAHNRTEELKMLATSVNTTRLQNNPIDLTQDAIESIYSRILA